MRVSTLAFQPFLKSEARTVHKCYQPLKVAFNDEIILQADVETSVWLQVSDLISLGINWDGNGAAAIAPVTAKRMIADMSSISEGCRSLWAPWIVPAADGSLQAEWDTQNLEILYLIDDEGKRSVYIDDRQRGEEYEAEGNAALTLARRFAKKLVDGQMAPSAKPVLDTGCSSSTTAYTPELEAA